MVLNCDDAGDTSPYVPKRALTSQELLDQVIAQSHQLVYGSFGQDDHQHQGLTQVPTMWPLKHWTTLPMQKVPTSPPYRHIHHDNYMVEQMDKITTGGQAI